MGQILRDIYSNSQIASLLGFKGGTCVYFFYDLTRFSVDLDFDLLAAKQKKLVANEIKIILEKYGKLTDFAIKAKTILFELSYEENARRLKVEISTVSPIKNLGEEWYEIKKYFGISMKVASRAYMFSCKLVALTSRGKFTMRDVYDVWYFASKGWPLDAGIVKSFVGKGLGNYLEDCISWIKNIKSSQLLIGLGELLDEKEKRWIKTNLKNEAIAFLEIYKKNIGA